MSLSASTDLSSSRFPCCFLSYFSLVLVMFVILVWQIQITTVSRVGNQLALKLVEKGDLALDLLPWQPHTHPSFRFSNKDPVRCWIHIAKCSKLWLYLFCVWLIPCINHDIIFQVFKQPSFYLLDPHWPLHSLRGLSDLLNFQNQTFFTRIFLCVFFPLSICYNSLSNVPFLFCAKLNSKLCVYCNFSFLFQLLLIFCA